MGTRAGMQSATTVQTDGHAMAPLHCGALQFRGASLGELETTWHLTHFPATRKSLLATLSVPQHGVLAPPGSQHTQKGNKQNNMRNRQCNSKVRPHSWQCTPVGCWSTSRREHHSLLGSQPTP